MLDVEGLRLYNKLLDPLSLSGVRELLTNRRILLDDRETHVRLVLSCILGYDNSNILQVLYECGMNVDISKPDDPNGRAIYAAANVRHWGCVRWLVEHGAEVNFEVPGRVPYCVPLPSVIRAGKLEMVKLLVEAGGMVNGIDRRGQTPLDWAVACNAADIADYLRSVGAVRGADLDPPATVPVTPPPPPPDTKPKSKKRK